MKVVHVCANPKPIEESASKQLAAAFFETLAEKNPEVEIDNIDLYSEPPPFLSVEALRALYYPSFDPDYQPTEEERRACEYAAKQAARLREADVLVLTTPMWNFSLPGIVKSWIDQVFSPGNLFQFEGTGTKPLHSIRQAILLAASGGVYKEDRAGGGPGQQNLRFPIGQFRAHRSAGRLFRSRMAFHGTQRLPELFLGKSIVRQLPGEIGIIGGQIQEPVA